MDQHEEQHESGCQCDACLDFLAWCDAFPARWAAHKRANEELKAELDAFLENMSDPAFNAHPAALR